MGDLLPWVRRVSLIEAVSLLVLSVTSYGKHFLDWPVVTFVRVCGMIHGVLFLVLVWILVRVCVDGRWPVRRALLVFVASLVPVWPFFLDRRLREWTRPGVRPA